MTRAHRFVFPDRLYNILNCRGLATHRTLLKYSPSLRSSKSGLERKFSSFINTNPPPQAGLLPFPQLLTFFTSLSRLLSSNISSSLLPPCEFVETIPSIDLVNARARLMEWSEGIGVSEGGRRLRMCCVGR